MFPRKKAANVTVQMLWLVSQSLCSAIAPLFLDNVYFVNSIDRFPDLRPKDHDPAAIRHSVKCRSTNHDKYSNGKQSEYEQSSISIV